MKWAKKHLTQLEEVIDTFLATDPYKVEKKPHPSVPDCFAYYVSSVPSAIPMEIPFMAGDVLFNLRASLDHLAYQLAQKNGTSDKKILRDTSFPIFDSIADYGRFSHNKMKGMSKAAITAIDAVKPYYGGNNLLWQLHRLNNIDKHRVLVTVGSALGWHSLPVNINQHIVETLKDAHAQNQISDWEDVMGSHTPGEIVDVNVRPPFRNCPLRIGNELALAFDHPAIHKDADLRFKFEIAFSEPDIINSEPVVATLRAMARVIDGILLDFKPLFDS